MPKLKNCECWRCEHKWMDYPGMHALRTKAMRTSLGGCPNCGCLYWSETDEQTTEEEKKRLDNAREKWRVRYV